VDIHDRSHLPPWTMPGQLLALAQIKKWQIEPIFQRRFAPDRQSTIANPPSCRYIAQT